MSLVVTWLVLQAANLVHASSRSKWLDLGVQPGYGTRHSVVHSSALQVQKIHSLVMPAKRLWARCAAAGNVPVAGIEPTHHVAGGRAGCTNPAVLLQRAQKRIHRLKVCGSHG